MECDTFLQQGMNVVGRKVCSNKKDPQKILKNKIFLKIGVRQPTLIRDASRAPRSDVAALRRKGNRQNPGFGAEIPILARLGQAEQLTIPATTVVQQGRGVRTPVPRGVVNFTMITLK